MVGASAAMWLTVNQDNWRDTSGAFAGLPWLSLATLLVLAVVAVTHYVCAGIALRDVASAALPLRQVTLAQLAAAATNRLVPSGMGGAGINLRYLTRAGVPAGAATSAVAGLAVVGGLTDALYVAGISGIGPSLGFGGARAELSALARSSLSSGRSHGWLVAAIVGVGLVVVLVRLRGRLVAALIGAMRQAAGHVLSLVRRPGQMARAATASMATTAVLSIGFVLAVHTWGSSSAPLPAGGLIALYWVAIAAGNAVPLPPVFGVTEAALITGLVLSGYSATSATTCVVVFRIVTYWLALPAGVWAGRRLRRAALL
ncbi:MAG TPA: lysylphosphatidylglycerol synthase domain-containing protein [Mycobacteriales bacterium]|jgi:uncharacterized membrane protein YbhN (UPF0104 family)|nr:lysylphosphatidylglycerol synthase domain-containing protein [Mycobacteriales bacterium]